MNELRPSYSVLPLSRLTESDPDAMSKLLEDGALRLTNMTTMTESLLTRAASHVLPGQEVLTRTNLNETTVNSYGEKVLFRVRTADRDILEGAVNQGIKKRKFEETPRKCLQRMKLNELEALAVQENVQLPTTAGRITKAEYIDCILSGRASIIDEVQVPAIVVSESQLEGRC